jgi:sugar phosphate isomerase/epimerase
VNSPALTACLDVGHSQLYSKLPVSEWLDNMNGWITYFHMNNNYGEIDEHLALDEGVMDYTRILPILQQVKGNPAFTLEIETVEDIQRSLVFMGIPEVLSK